MLGRVAGNNLFCTTIVFRKVGSMVSPSLLVADGLGLVGGHGIRLLPVPLLYRWPRLVGRAHIAPRIVDGLHRHFVGIGNELLLMHGIGPGLVTVLLR